MTAIRTIAVLGAGTIGMSWATLFLAKGLTVRLRRRGWRPAADPGLRRRRLGP